MRRPATVAAPARARCQVLRRELGRFLGAGSDRRVRDRKGDRNRGRDIQVLGGLGGLGGLRRHQPRIHRRALVLTAQESGEANQANHDERRHRGHAPARRTSVPKPRRVRRFLHRRARRPQSMLHLLATGSVGLSELFLEVGRGLQEAILAHQGKFDVAQLRRDIGGGLGAIFRGLGQQPHRQRDERRRHPLAFPTQIRGRVREDRFGHFTFRIASIETPADDHFIESHAEREDIGAAVRLFETELLRGHIAELTLEHALGGPVAGPRSSASDSKVGDPRDSVEANEDILWRYVTMHELQLFARDLRPQLVGGVETCDGVARDPQADGKRHEFSHLSHPAHDVGARKPIDVVHDEEGTIVVFAIVENTDHVRVPQETGDTRFFEKHASKRTIVAEIGVDAFAGVKPAKPATVPHHQLHDAHAPTLQVEHVNVVRRRFVQGRGEHRLEYTGKPRPSKDVAFVLPPLMTKRARFDDVIYGTVVRTRAKARTGLLAGLLAGLVGCGSDSEYSLSVRTDPPDLAQSFDVLHYCVVRSCGAEADPSVCGVLRRTDASMSIALDLPAEATAIQVTLSSDDCVRRATGCTGDLTFESGEGTTIEVVAREAPGNCDVGVCCGGQCLGRCETLDAGLDARNLDALTLDARTDAPASDWAAAHLSLADSEAGADGLVLDGEIIDTDALTVGGAPVGGGNVFETVSQLDGGGRTAVLRVGTLGLRGEVRVTGSAPLLIIAAGDVEIAGVLDLGAEGGTPGPGGFRTDIGRGAGGPGMASAGGGGAGHLQAGAPAGVRTGSGVAGVTAPSAFLVGGSGGGSAQSEVGCRNSGGGGGGAVQISTRGDIVITPAGAIDVGGGGGDRDCPNIESEKGGPGGGAGGMIYLQAARITNSGILVANGGGGAASGGRQPGLNGNDGTRTTQQASGGDGNPGTTLPGGGAGGSLEGDPIAGEAAMSNGLSGGGGGGAGPIYVQGEFTSRGTTSPAATPP